MIIALEERGLSFRLMTMFQACEFRYFLLRIVFPEFIDLYLAPVTVTGILHYQI